VEDWSEGVIGVALVVEVAMEGFSVDVNFTLGGTESVDAKHIAKDESSEHAFGMCGVWGDIQLEVLLFFVEGHVDLTILYF